MNALVQSNAEAYRASTDAAGMCRDIVIAAATTIQGRKYVSVEGWQAIAIAHGCAAGAEDVQAVEGGVRARGVVRRMSDGVIISTAEGFVGVDEPTWYGGQSRGKTLPKRPDYAIRAMAQTRAISRACRSSFAHVVLLMNAGLSTTPAEEVPAEGFDNGNVINATVIANDRPTHTSEEHGKRDKPQPLEGVHKTRKALRDAYDAIVAELRGAADVDSLKVYLITQEPTIKQLREIDYDKNPMLWDGMPEPDTDRFPGMSREIANAFMRLETYDGEIDDDQAEAGQELVRRVNAG